MSIIRRYKDILAGIFLLFGAALLPVSETSAQIESPENRETVHPHLKEYATDVFLPHLGQGAKASFGKKESLLALGAGAVIAALIHVQDEKIDDYWHAENLLGDAAGLGDVWGSGEIQAVSCIAMYSWARHTGNQELATTSEVLAEAMIIQMLTVHALKIVVARERPDEQDNMSFPSGHTAAAFTMAAVIDHRYGHKWGIPLYALAVLTGLERMQDHMHYASDVAMGATIAMVVGYQTSRYHDDYPYENTWGRKGGKGISVMPWVFGRDGVGLMLAAPLD